MPIFVIRLISFCACKYTLFYSIIDSILNGGNAKGLIKYFQS